MDSPSVADAVPATFKDRKVGLVIFGILTILMGLICLLLIAFVIGANAAAGKTAANAMGWQAIIMMVGVYGSICVINIWLGIGSIMTRRWARALLLIFSWGWLVIGICTVALFSVMFTLMLKSGSSNWHAGVKGYSGISCALMFVPLLFLVGIFIFLPLLWMLFYGGKNVKATCENRDPVICWTDRCPLPVLAVVLLLIFGAVSMIGMLFVYGGMMPFFGMLLSGIPGTVIYLIIAAIWLYCARAFYRLDLQGWWIAVSIFCLLGISQTITYSHHSMVEMAAIMYRNMPAEQLKVIQSPSWVNSSVMIWMGLFNLVLMLGYLLYIRKFFPRKIG